MYTRLNVEDGKAWDTAKSANDLNEWIKTGFRLVNI